MSGIHWKDASKLLLISIVFGANFPLSKYAIASLGVWNFRLIAAAAAGVFMVIVFQRSIRSIVAMPRRTLCLLAGLAVPNLFLVPTLNNIALTLTTSSKASILIYAMPGIVSIIAMAASRQWRMRSLAASALAFLGIALLTRSTTLGPGEILVLISAVIWAGGTFATSKWVPLVKPVDGMVVQTLVSLVLVLISRWVFGGDILAVTPALALPLLATFFVGVVGGALVFLAWFSLLAARGAEFVAYSSLLSLVFGVALAIGWLGEPLTTTSIVSCLLMAGSVGLVVTDRRRAT